MSHTVKNVLIIGLIAVGAYMAYGWWTKHQQLTAVTTPPAKV